MPVKPILIAAAVSGLAFYALGRYGQEAAQRTPLPAIQPAQAQDAGEPPASAATAAAAELAQALQRPAPGQPAAQRPAAGAPTPASQPDESALRYFAAQGDTRRLEAELARLAASEPGWQAPADLVAQLDRAEAAQRLVNASDARQWEQVIRIGTETPALLTCANVDALWRVADAFVQTGKPERARDAYAYVLTNCTNPAERVGTMQKAVGSLPEALVAGLLQQERQNEFAGIRDELARRRIGRAADAPGTVASAEDLQRIEALANAATTPDDPILLGFYALHHADPAKAATWFQTALARKGGAKAAEGAVLALGAMQNYAEAEALGAQWLEAGPANRKAYLDVATALITQEPPPRLDGAVLQRIARTVGTERYAPGGAGLGWYAYNSGQTAMAETWFTTALGWDRNDEPAAFGLALTRQRLRDQAGLRAVVAEWRNRSDRIAAILDPRRRSVSAARLSAPEPAPPPPPANATEATPQRSDAAAPRRVAREIEPAPADETLGTSPVAGGNRLRRSAGGRCGGSALARGWCLLNLKRPAEAALAFEAAMRGGSEAIAADAAAGLAYAKIQQGLTAEAGVAAAGANLPPARRRDLSAVLLSERFYAQYDAQNYNAALITLSERARYAPETTDLMLMRGWSYFKLGRYDDATKVFRALYKANGSAQAMAGLTAIRDATQRNRY